MRLVAAAAVSNGRPVRLVDCLHQVVHSDLVPRHSEEPFGAHHWRDRATGDGEWSSSNRPHTAVTAGMPDTDTAPHTSSGYQPASSDWLKQQPTAHLHFTHHPAHLHFTPPYPAYLHFTPPYPAHLHFAPPCPAHLHFTPPYPPILTVLHVGNQPQHSWAEGSLQTRLTLNTAAI